MHFDMKNPFKSIFLLHSYIYIYGKNVATWSRHLAEKGLDPYELKVISNMTINFPELSYIVPLANMVLCYPPFN